MFSKIFSDFQIDEYNSFSFSWPNFFKPLVFLFSHPYRTYRFKRNINEVRYRDKYNEGWNAWVSVKRVEYGFESTGQLLLQVKKSKHSLVRHTNTYFIKCELMCFVEKTEKGTLDQNRMTKFIVTIEFSPMSRMVPN